MKDVLDVVAAFSAGLRALDIRVSSVALSREDGRRFAAALQDDQTATRFTVPRVLASADDDLVKVQVMGIEFRWPA